MAVVLSATGCLGGASTMPRAADARLTLRMDEQTETALLAANGQRGRFVLLDEGRPGTPTVITVHGINAAPDALQPLHDAALRRGARLLTFAYDDQRRRLGLSSAELAWQLIAERQRQPQRRLVIQAHSMGARITVAALSIVASFARHLGPVELVLVAPLLEGVSAANLAQVSPALVAPLIPGVLPGADIGTRSDFQKALAGAHFPPTITTHIYVGDRDEIVAPRDPRFVTVAANLRATVTVVLDADHESILRRVADGHVRTWAYGSSTSSKRVATSNKRVGAREPATAVCERQRRSQPGPLLARSTARRAARSEHNDRSVPAPPTVAEKRSLPFGRTPACQQGVAQRTAATCTSSQLAGAVE